MAAMILLKLVPASSLITKLVGPNARNGDHIGDRSTNLSRREKHQTDEDDILFAESLDTMLNSASRERNCQQNFSS